MMLMIHINFMASNCSMKDIEKIVEDSIVVKIVSNEIKQKQ